MVTNASPPSSSSSDADPPRDAPPIERVPTGVPGLDEVLGGGLLRGGTYILMGPPGAGKTILGNQICFHSVAHGGRAVYVTLLAESHGHMIAHLRGLRFFDAAPIAEELTYVSGYRTLEREGIAGLLDLLRKQVREHRSSLLVLDGLVSAGSFAESELAFKKFIHELHTLVSVIGCTTLLLTNGSSKPISPEHTMVDGLIELSDSPRGLRSVRELSVRKFRGSSHYRGSHFFEIGEAGVVVHPRTEARFGLPHDALAQSRPVSTGIEALDLMLGEGVLEGSTSLVMGPPGAGKTILGLQFLAAAAATRESALHVGFFESPDRLQRTSDKLGLPLATMGNDGLLTYEWQSQGELLADAIVTRLLAIVDRRQVRRVVIDGLQGLRQAIVYPERLPQFLGAMAAELRRRRVTTLITDEQTEPRSRKIAPEPGCASHLENLIELRHEEGEGAYRRCIAVVKSRDFAPDARVRWFEIGPRGIVIGTGSIQRDAAFAAGDERDRAAAPQSAEEPAEGAGRPPRRDGQG